LNRIRVKINKAGGISEKIIRRVFLNEMNCRINGIDNKTKVSLMNIDKIRRMGSTNFFSQNKRISPIAKTEGISVMSEGIVLNIPGDEIIAIEISKVFLE
jgi:hypothetical protein